MFRNLLSFYNELLAPRPNLKMKDFPLQAVRDWLFNIFAATVHTSTYEYNVNRINYVKTVKTWRVTSMPAY